MLPGRFDPNAGGLLNEFDANDGPPPNPPKPLSRNADVFPGPIDREEPEPDLKTSALGFFG